MIDNTLIHFKTEAAFNTAVENGDISNDSIVFIQENKKIYTHGNYYGGDGNVVNEKLYITLTSNQSQPDTTLNGTSIVVTNTTDNEVVFNGVWEGQELIVPVAPLVNYTVEVGSVEHYTQPNNVSGVTRINGETSYIFNYNTCVVTVNLDSNQSDKSDLASATATVVYDSVSRVVSSGDSVKVPLGKSVTITPSSVTGYSVSGTTITADSVGKNVDIMYNTSVVTVASISGLPDGTTVNATVEYGSTSVEVAAGGYIKVPYGQSVVVSVPDVKYYKKSANVSFTTSQPSHSASFTYEYAPINYITLDQTKTDPATMLSGDINGSVVQWIRNNSHRVLAKKSSDGVVKYVRLKDDDSTYYYDGTKVSVQTYESMGNDTMLKLPVFYWQCIQQSTDVFKIGLADADPGEGWNKWEGDNNLLGVYEGYVSSNNLYSVSGMASSANATRNNFRTYADNRGTGYSCVTWEWHCIMAMLYYCQYGHMNCQEKIGYGTSSYTKSTGATNALGMEDTVKGGNGDSNSINFWGLENWWGNKYEWVDNVDINNYVWTLTKADGSGTRTIGTAPSSSNYISKMLLGSNFDMMPSTVSGSSTTGYCDYYYQNSGTRVLARSYSGAGDNGGVAFVSANCDASYASPYVGSRLAFRGTLVEATPSTF